MMRVMLWMLAEPLKALSVALGADLLILAAMCVNALRTAEKEEEDEKNARIASASKAEQVVAAAAAVQEKPDALDKAELELDEVETRMSLLAAGHREEAMRRRAEREEQQQEVMLGKIVCERSEAKLAMVRRARAVRREHQEGKTAAAKQRLKKAEPTRATTAKLLKTEQEGVDVLEAEAKRRFGVKASESPVNPTLQLVAPSLQKNSYRDLTPNEEEERQRLLMPRGAGQDFESAVASRIDGKEDSAGPAEEEGLWGSGIDLEEDEMAKRWIFK